MRRRRRKPQPVEKKEEFRINKQIRVREVRLVGEGIESDVYPTEEALRIAQEQELDLVEISPNAKPPVCRVVDYQKFLYDRKKKQKELKAKQQKTVIKEIRFTSNTDEHDFAFKAKHAEKFLQDGAKVKAFVQFRGRNIVFKERGELLLLKFAQRLEEFGAVEQLPKLEGRRMSIFIAPKVKKK